MAAAHDKAPIAFVARGLASRWPDLEGLDAAGLDREQARVRSGVDAWIVQGYVRLAPLLRARGFDVRASGSFVRGAICVAHRDDLNRYQDPLHDCFVVAVRADRPPVEVAAIEVTQNGLAPTPRSRFIPSWPQPGLLPRDAARGDRVERVVYFGRSGSVPKWYQDGRLAAQLAALGIAFEVREKSWNDYSDADVLVAHREETPTMLRQKPAAKLANAWLAGVPAVLPPEPAFRELRRSDLDYAEADTLEGVVAAVRALRDDPRRYRAMVDHGHDRARDYDAPAIASRWMDLLTGEANDAWAQWRRERPALALRYLAHLRDMSSQKIAAKAFRRREREERSG